MAGGDRVAARIAGACAGLAGLTTFLVLHHAMIAPIWFILPLGAAVAAGGGALIGSAYLELLPRLPAHPWRIVAVAACFGLPLAPAMVIAEATGPTFVMDASGSGTLLVPVASVITAFSIGLVGTAVATGAAIGALVGRTRSTSLWMALAGGVLAIGPGHNIPFLGGTSAVGSELTLLLLVLAVASVTLVEVHFALEARRRRPA